jgi:DNA (cytosine-5)-methyltransferase 1
MIFELVTSCQNKGLFKELILTYVRIAESCAEKLKVKMHRPKMCNVAIVNEMRAIGVIDSNKDIPSLLNLLGESLFNRFVAAVDLAVVNPEVVGSLLNKLSNKKRQSLQRAEARSKKPTFVDFFAGAGGLSKGFTDAGYRVVFANDFQDVCVSTYRFNHPELPADRVSSQDVRKIVDDIGRYINRDVDVVVGGPPCQGFSSANKQPIIDDPRNELYKYFLKAIKELLPKFVVMENVKGMLSVANQVVDHYKSIRGMRDGRIYTYSVAYRLMNSADFGVAQNRERLIYIAVRNDIGERFHITPECLFAGIAKANVCSRPFLLRDALEAIRPLEAPRVKNQNDVDSEVWGRTIEPNRFIGNENAYLKLINGGRRIPLTFNHRARYLNDVNFDIYRLLDQGDDATNEKIAAIMPYAHRNHCFKDKYFKLRSDRPARTITAHLKMDCHSHIHPFQIRAITPREAARCQSFPDDYLFLGAYLKTYMEIGNAVPVLMARGIALELLKYLQR